MKLALNDRSSDGKSFVISDKSIRRKLKYHYEKAVAAIQASMNLENELGDEAIPQASMNIENELGDDGVQILIDKLTNQKITKESIDPYHLFTLVIFLVTWHCNMPT